MNDNSRLAREAAGQALQFVARERDTARSGVETGPGDVDEYRTAMAGNAGARIVVDFDDKIIESVGALKTVAWFIGRPPERPVVAPVLGIFAPRIMRSDAPDRKLGARARQAIGPPPQPKGVELPCRRGAVAFAFRWPDARPPQSRADRTLPGDEPSLRTQMRADVNMDCRQRGLTHCLAPCFILSSRHQRRCRRQVPKRNSFNPN